MEADLHEPHDQPIVVYKMAMAANPLDDLITCSVCLEVCRNPQELSCRHTYCSQCVQSLNQQNQVKCPDCRAYTNIGDVKKDFKMDSLISALQINPAEENPENPIQKVCDICTDPNKPTHSLYRICEESICTDCAQAQRGNKQNTTHKLTAFKGLHKFQQCHSNEPIQLVKDECVSVEEKISSNKELVINVCLQKARQIAKVDELENILIKQVKRHHQILRNQIYSFNNEQIESLEQNVRRLKIMAKGTQPGDDKVHFLSDLPTFDPIMKPLLTVVPGEDWNPKTSTRIQVDHTTLVPGRKLTVHKPTTLRALTALTIPHQYKKVIHSQYREVKSLDLEYSPQKICIYSNEVWVGGWDKGVFLYTPDLELTIHITHSQFKRVTSVIKCETDVIVCDSETGLHLLNEQGDYVTTICSGSFSDSCFTQSHRLYALEFKEGTVFVFKKSHNIWAQETQFQLSGYCNGHVSDKLCTNNISVYISSYYSHCVSVYSHNCELQVKTGEKGWGECTKTGKFFHPLLSEVDNGGKLLLCDWGNHRLQVCDTERREWSALRGVEKARGPLCAGVGEKHLWVGTSYHQNRLLKYEMN